MSGLRFPEETKKKARKMYAEKKSIGQIMAATGAAHTTIYKWIDDSGIRRRRFCPRYSEAKKAEVLELFETQRRMTLEDIGLRAGVSKSSVKKWVREAALAPRGSGVAKYDEHDRDHALTLFADEVPIAEIVKETGVCAKTIYDWAQKDGITRPRKVQRVPPAKKEDAITRYELGDKMEDISRDTGFHRETIRKWARERGLEPRKKERIDHTEIVRLRQRFSIREVAEIVGHSRYGVSQALKRAASSARA